MVERALVNLRDFIRTGEFAGVGLGATEAEILALLGEPDHVGGTSRRQRRPLIWKYGDFELHFPPEDDRLKRIYIDDFDIPRGGRTLVLDPWIIRRDLSRAELVAALAVLELDPVVWEDAPLERWVVAASTGVTFEYCSTEDRLPAETYATPGLEELYAFSLGA